MGYSVKRVDLSQPFEDYALVEPGTRVRSVIFTQLDSGAVLRLAIGSNPLFHVPNTMAITVEDDADDATSTHGVTLTNPLAQPGLTAEIVIVSSGRA